ncbi:MAG: undecaprenyl/decaprenyl-phosphate alpha-N-acetylglucosaminyl 1-phosphate transferase [Propionibacteriaceae bacterium]|jgi:UDP-GlcNAc:undecaprenyl-phosphate GlcNAc-1-phosphate transferase|nr:undecaprenyl/decaprenyl-phosphate alpha-N-acetylglucosaminyl 1-phosphate transferase [Propionibacteriaceae bacterium]
MREYILVLLLGLATAYLLAPACRSLALRCGAVAKVRGRDVHEHAMPYFGGLAMLGGVAVTFLVASRLPFLSRHSVVTRESLVILAGAAVICAVGVCDDIFELSALLKGAGQVLAAGVIVLGDVRLLWIPWGDRIIALDRTTSVVITVLAIFLITNAINFIDGLDGLAAGVLTIGSGAFFVYAYWLTVEEDLVRATTATLVTAAICGVCLGYLPHNFHPARMFMGDSGSMLLGLLIASSTISLTGQIDPTALDRQSSLAAAVMPLLMPFAVLALPLLDLALAFVRRTRHGTWWFVPDKGHLHHRLLQRGHSQVGAVLLMYAWTALVGFSAIALGMFPSRFTLIGVGLVLITVVIFTLAPAKSRRSPGPAAGTAPAADPVAVPGPAAPLEPALSRRAESLGEDGGES